MELIYLYLLPTTVALIWLVAFLLGGRHRRLHDRMMLGFLLAGGLILFITQRIILTGACDYWAIAYDGLAMLLELCICPLLFIYIRSVTRDTRWHNGYLWLFAPAVLFFAVDVVLSLSVGWDRILDIKQHGFAPFLPDADDAAERWLRLMAFNGFYIVIELMAVVLIGVSIYDLVKYHRHSADYFANLEDSSFSHMHRILVFAILLFLSMFLLSWLFPEVGADNGGLLIFRSLWFSAIIWLIAHNAYRIVLSKKQLDALELEEEEEQQPEPQAVAALDDALRQQIEAWQQRTDKPFCREGLTRQEAATEIGIPPRALSDYVNREHGQNFNQWINVLRIEEAKHLLRALPDEKLANIAAQCGYSAPSAFTRAFSQLVGQSPTAWRGN